MLFPTVEYALFFVGAFIGAWALARRPWAHKAFLLVASWVFYAFGDWRFLPVLIGLSLEAALVGKALELPASERVRRGVLALGVTAVLGTLGLFKYLGFFASHLRLLVGRHLLASLEEVLRDAVLVVINVEPLLRNAAGVQGE